MKRRQKPKCIENVCILRENSKNEINEKWGPRRLSIIKCPHRQLSTFRKTYVKVELGMDKLGYGRLDRQLTVELA